MSPERTGTGTKRQKAQEVNTEVLCDENWKCDVVLLHEGDNCGSELANALQQIPAKQNFGSVKVINKSDILKDAKKSGGKVKKSSGKSQEEEKEVTDEQIIMRYIKENAAIPGKVLASVIKKQIFNMKVDDIKERKKELATFEQNQRKKAKLGTKGSKRGKKDEKDITKDDSKLENVFVERPPLFVILLGFNEYDLPIELVKQKVPMCATVKLVAEDFADPEIRDLDFLTDLSSDKFNMPWIVFWRKFDKAMNSPENLEIGSDLATIPYNVPQEFNSINIKEKKNFAINQLSEIMKHTRNLLEMHKLYRQNLVPYNITETLMTEKADLYNTLIQMVPLECTSIQLILFTMIEQVCHWNGDEIEIDITCETNSCDSEHNDGTSNNINVPQRAQSLPNKNMKRHPVIIRNNDEESLKTFHLDIPEIDFNKLSIRFLSKSFLLSHWRQQKTDHFQRYFMEFHLQRLWRLAYKEIHLNLFYIYLHFYIFGKMKSYYYTSYLARNKPLSDESFGNHGVVPDISSNHNLLLDWMNEIKLKETEIEISEQKLDFINSEDQQRINKATDITANENGDKDTNKDVNDKHDDDTNQEINTSEDYDSGTSSEIRELTEQRTVYSITNKRNQSLSVLSEFLNLPEILCLYENNISLSNLTPHFKSFISYKFIEEMKPTSLLQSLHEAVSNFSQIHSVYYYPSNKILLWFHNTSLFVERKTGRLETILGFRDYCDIIINTEGSLAKQNNSIPNKDSAKIDDQEVRIRMNNGDGLKDGNMKEGVANVKTTVYNLGKRKLQFDQLTKRFSSEDGSSVIVEIEDWDPSSQFIHVCIKKIDTEMNIFIKKLPLLLDDYNSFQNEPVETMNLSLKLPNNILLNVKVEEKVDSTAMNAEAETQFCYHDLIITLPNGLMVQVLKNIYDNNNIYIRQSFTAKNITCNKIWDEKCRCFDRSGTIVIFKNDDTIDVIYNSTAVGKIIKIEKLITETIEEVAAKVTAVKPTKESPKKGSKKDKTKQKAPVVEEPKVEGKSQESNREKSSYIIIENFIKSWSGFSYHYRGNCFIDVTDNNVNLRTIFLPYTQLYIDRNDGTKCLFTDDGRLISSYRDGTMVTSLVYEEPDNIDLLSLLPLENEEQDSDDNSTAARLSGYFNINFSKFDNQPEGYYLDDETYVSYKTGYTAEHPNYCTVMFSPINDSISLILPGNILVTIHDIQHNGMYDFRVNVNNKAVTDFAKQSISFKSNIIKKCKKHNITTIFPIGVKSTLINDAAYFCKTIDSFGYIYLVDTFGEVKLDEPESKIEREGVTSTTYEGEFYYENKIPKKMNERFFVVNEDFSGYEVLNQNDIQLLDEQDETRFKNVDTIKNPTNNRIFSKTSQYRVYKNYSESFLMQPIVDFINVVPTTFQRGDLGPTWTPMQSPWLFVRPEVIGYRPFSFTHFPKHTDDRIIAVVIKTIQQVTDSNNFNGLDIIMSCLEKYKIENEKLCNKYKQQSFTDYEVDSRLKENHILITSIKKEFPLWNVPRTKCNTCKQTFSFPAKAPSDIFNPSSKAANSEVEKVICKIDY